MAAATSKMIHPLWYFSKIKIIKILRLLLTQQSDESHQSSPSIRFGWGAFFLMAPKKKTSKEMLIRGGTSYRGGCLHDGVG
jgi:hypothetical protein